jgi:hypothetical protein
MQFYLEIMDGDQAGTQIPLADGMIIGRKGSDISLRDSKVSSKHARIEERMGTWFVVDLGSANGIKKDDQRVPEMLLFEGAEFIVGRTKFRIGVRQATDSLAAQATDLATDAPLGLDEGLKAHSSPPDWRETLRGLARASAKKQSKPVEITRLNPLLRLKFLTGMQMGTQWLIGYGPRAIGADSVDLPIEEPGSPACCFQLVPKENGILFQTEHQEHVRLNGRPVEVEYLNNGDVIQMKNTRIEVVFEIVE